jgi:hypothetical protein
LGAIAIDSDALNPSKSTDTDKHVSERILKRSRWNDKDLDDVMDDLDETLGDAKKDLDSFGLRDLLRRDWKGDFVDTPSPRTPTVHLGFASIPIAMDEQIKRTEWEQVFNWFGMLPYIKVGSTIFRLSLTHHSNTRCLDCRGRHRYQPLFKQVQGQGPGNWGQEED